MQLKKIKSKELRRMPCPGPPCPGHSALCIPKALSSGKLPLLSGSLGDRVVSGEFVPGVQPPGVVSGSPEGFPEQVPHGGGGGGH